MWTPGQTLEGIEKEAIKKAYQFYQQNKTQTAASLGISIRTLDNKLEKYETEDAEMKVRQDEYERREEDYRKRARGNVGQINAAANSPVNFETKENARSSKAGDAFESGLRMESTQRAPTQHEMPLPKREEVQSLSSKHASVSNTRKPR